ncbi:helix-turn-helix domain-containing protein [Peribacillus simplex]|uniref:helix-turn-helix domain-containing protein n=1 Tax=Peribacillus simplex TaxID=1478 RepID=UPI0024BFAE6C|nr:helix-turn-helix domain-containing protein [Peribacillus simplex]WHY95253.1 helix-turn-helix domain-containing protein [Peribacillus simplex]
MKIEVGSVINELRIKQNLTREELAKDICEPNTLSDYERSITSPTIDELALFADKLKVDLPYFFTTKNEPIYNYIETIKLLINKYKRTRNYEAIYEIVQKEMATAPEKSISFYQFLKWHEGISFFYLYNDKQRAIELLNETIQITMGKRVILHQQEIEVLNSIGIIHFKTKNYEEAINIFNEALEFIENIPHANQVGTIIVKIIHGLAQTLTELHYYQESLNYTLKGINICNSIESLYLYAELHLLTGKNLVHLQQPEKELHYIKQSKNIFSLQKNEEFIRIAEHELESILQCF